MKLKLIYILLTAILFLVLYLMKSQIIGLFFSSKEKQSVESIAKKYNSKVENSLKNAFEKTNIDSTDFEMAILAFNINSICALKCIDHLLFLLNIIKIYLIFMNHLNFKNPLIKSLFQFI